jgi:hypothetical protein
MAKDPPLKAAKAAAAPPKAKKPPSRSSSTSTRDSMQTNIATLEQQINDGQDFDMKFAISTIFLMLKRVDERDAAIKVKIEDIEDEVQSLKDVVRRIELEQFSTKILVRQANLHKDASNGRESFEQTCEVAENLVRQAKAKATVTDVRRLYYKKDPQKVPTLAMSFLSKIECVAFMRSLKNLSKSKDFAQVNVSRDFPPSMREKQQELDQRAFEMRKKGCKTLITVKNLDLVLLVKGKDEQNFSEDV